MGEAFLKEIGRSYIFSSLLPTVSFGIFGYFLFHGFIPLEMIYQIQAAGDLSKYQWLVLLILAVWMSVYLYSSSDITIKLFEGYFIPSFFLSHNTSQKDQRKWEKDNLPKYNHWKRIHEKLNDSEQIFTDKDIQSYYLSYMEALSEIYNVNQHEPLDVRLRLPTRLGNVFRASEIYAFERYNVLDAVMWPRLFLVLPNNMKKHLEDQYSLFMFLLNSAFLAFLLAALSIFFGFLGYFLPMLSLPKNFFHVGYSFIAPLSYVSFSIPFIFFGYTLYRIAVNVAIEVTINFRIGFDLYRTDLIRELNWEPPQSMDEEKSLWLELTKLIVGGNRFSVYFSPFTRRVAKSKEKHDKNAETP